VVVVMQSVLISLRIDVQHIIVGVRELFELTAAACERDGLNRPIEAYPPPDLASRCLATYVA
jgi:hypothetical protein